MDVKLCDRCKRPARRINLIFRFMEIGSKYVGAKNLGKIDLCSAHADIMQKRLSDVFEDTRSLVSK